MIEGGGSCTYIQQIQYSIPFLADLLDSKESKRLVSLEDDRGRGVMYIIPFLASFNGLSDKRATNCQVYLTELPSLEQQYMKTPNLYKSLNPISITM